jgi:hypothetical protein
MECELSDGTNEVDVEILVGCGAPEGNCRVRVAVIANGWCIFVGRPALMPAVRPSSANPIGPYFAACLAAGEVFKRLFEMITNGASRFVEQFFLSLWSRQTSAAWEELEQGPELRANAKVPPFYVVGAGAVGQAVIACLASAEEFGAEVVLIDADVIDPKGTNLNRCVLACQKDKGAAQVHSCSKCCRIVESQSVSVRRRMGDLCGRFLQRQAPSRFAVA